MANGRIFDGRKVVVLGAAGFIGGRLLPALKREGAHVVGVDMMPAPDGSVADEWAVADIVNLPLPDRLFEGVDTVVHLAWRNDPGRGNADLGADAATNVAASARLFQQAATLGVRRILYASSGGTVYGRADTPTPETAPLCPIGGYGAGKAAGELYLSAVGNAYGVQTCVLRISNPYGPGQWPNRGQGFVATALGRTLGRLPIELFGNAEISRDYIFIDDVVDAIVLAAADTTSPATWNIGSGVAVTLADVLKLIFEAVGHDTPISYLNQRPMDCDKVQLDISEAGRALGWRPKVSMADGIALALAWQRQVAQK